MKLKNENMLFLTIFMVLLFNRIMDLLFNHKLYHRLNIA